MPETETADTTQPTDQQAEAPSSAGLSLLAKDHYGRNFHGEVKEQQSDAPTEEAPVVELEDPEAEEIEASEDTDEEADAKPGEGDEEEGADEETPVSSIEELVEIQEWDPDWFNSLDVPVKVDGEPAKAKLSDLVANYQMNKAADRRLEDVKAKAKSFTEEMAAKEAQLGEQFATAASLIEGAEKLLDAESSNIDWNSLRADDPAEYSAKKAEMAERKDAIEQAKKEAASSYQKAMEQRQAETQKERQDRLAQEQELLLKAVPEWQEPAKAKQEHAELRDYLIEGGFTEQDVMEASDHRLIVLARKAMLFDRGQSKVNAAKKKVRTVPKVMKPGTPKPQEQASRDKVQKARAQLRKSGSLDDAYAALKAKRGG